MLTERSHKKAKQYKCLLYNFRENADTSRALENGQPQTFNHGVEGSSPSALTKRNPCGTVTSCIFGH